MRVCLMIEGQENVTWEQWRALGAACEEHGFEALFRSDHYLSVEGMHDRGSLDAWATLSALGAITSRIRLGTLVSPATFRHPSVLAKMAASVDHVSGGRVELGMGAGWLESEHRAYGFPFADTRTRLDVLAEQLEIVARSWMSEPFSFDGEHYRIEELDALPTPLQEPRPTLILGGRGGRRSLALAARWADEYNTYGFSPERVRELRAALAEPVRFSAMLGVLVGASESELRDRAARLIERRGATATLDDFIEGVRDTWIVGTPDQAAERLREYEQAGVERVMLQHLLHDDLDSVALIGREIIPAVA
jgi:F420-dependent oxidoreductase-like protein